MFSKHSKFINDKFLKFLNFFRVIFLRYFECLINFVINVLDRVLTIVFVILLKFLNFLNNIDSNFKKLFLLISIKFQNESTFKIFVKNLSFSSKTFFTIVLNERFTNAKKLWISFFIWKICNISRNLILIAIKCLTKFKNLTKFLNKN